MMGTRGEGVWCDARLGLVRVFELFGNLGVGFGWWGFVNVFGN